MNRIVISLLLSSVLGAASALSAQIPPPPFDPVQPPLEGPPAEEPPAEEPPAEEPPAEEPPAEQPQAGKPGKDGKRRCAMAEQVRELRERLEADRGERKARVKARLERLRESLRERRVSRRGD